MANETKVDSPPISTPYLTHDEAAAYLKMTPRKFHGYIKQIRRLEMTRQHILFHPDDLDAFARRFLQDPAPIQSTDELKAELQARLGGIS